MAGKARNVSLDAPTAVRGAASLAFSRLATQVFLVVTAFILPRFLGPELYGRYAGLMAIAAICSAISTMGFPLIEARRLAPLVQASDEVRYLPLAATIMYARTVLCVVSAFFAMIWAGSSSFLHLEGPLLILIFAYCILRYLNESSNALVLGFGRPMLLGVLEFIRAFLALPIAIGSFFVAELQGLFAGLAILHGCLWLAGRIALRPNLPIFPLLFGWRFLKSTLYDNVHGAIGLLSATLQMWLSVYLVAAWVAPEDAGILAIGVQAGSVMKSLFLGGHQAMLPILAGLQAHHMPDKVNRWASLILRFSCALICGMIVTWTLIGPVVVTIALGENYLPAYPATSLILTGTLFYACGTTCNGVLYIKNQTSSATMSLFVYTTATVCGLGVVASTTSDSGIVLNIAGVYAVAGFIFFCIAYGILGLRIQLWLPLRRTFCLASPLAFLPLLHGWHAWASVRICAALFFLVAYLAAILLFRLLTLEELKSIWNAARRGSAI